MELEAMRFVPRSTTPADPADVHLHRQAESGIRQVAVMPVDDLDFLIRPRLEDAYRRMNWFSVTDLLLEMIDASWLMVRSPGFLRILVDAVLRYICRASPVRVLHPLDRIGRVILKELLVNLVLNRAC